MRQTELFITDCDHESTAIEAAVCQKEGVEFTLCQCQTAQDVIDQCKGAKALINQYAPLDRRVFEALPEVKFVVRYGVGVDNINLADATACGVQVCNVPDYGMNEVADQAIAMMMALVRKLPTTDRDIKRGVWDYTKAVPIRRMSEMTVGVLGLGRIGGAFARRLVPFGCRVIGHDVRTPGADFSPPEFVQEVGFERLLAESDVISVHCSLNDSTRKLFNEAAFKAMKPSAYFINVSRGGIVDESALEKALKEGWIAGVGLDVLEKEPILADHFLMECDNVILSPHIAWYSEESAEELKRKCAEEAVAFLAGRPIRYPVNQPDKEV